MHPKERHPKGVREETSNDALMEMGLAALDTIRLRKYEEQANLDKQRAEAASLRSQAARLDMYRRERMRELEAELASLEEIIAYKKSREVGIIPFHRKPEATPVQKRTSTKQAGQKG